MEPLSSSSQTAVLTDNVWTDPSKAITTATSGTRDVSQTDITMTTGGVMSGITTAKIGAVTIATGGAISHDGTAPNIGSESYPFGELYGIGTFPLRAYRDSTTASAHLRFYNKNSSSGWFFSGDFYAGVTSSTTGTETSELYLQGYHSGAVTKFATFAGEGAEISEAHIGAWSTSTGTARIGHKDWNIATGACLIQTSSGKVSLDTAAGTSLDMQIGGASIASMTSSGLLMASGKKILNAGGTPGIGDATNSFGDLYVKGTFPLRAYRDSTTASAHLRFYNTNTSGSYFESGDFYNQIDDADPGQETATLFFQTACSGTLAQVAKFNCDESELKKITNGGTAYDIGEAGARWGTLHAEEAILYSNGLTFTLNVQGYAKVQRTGNVGMGDDGVKSVETTWPYATSIRTLFQSTSYTSEATTRFNACIYGRMAARYASSNAPAAGVMGHSNEDGYTSRPGTRVGVAGLAEADTNVTASGQERIGGHFIAVSNDNNTKNPAYGVRGFGNIISTGGSADCYGGEFQALGAQSSGTAYGVYATASGAETNWAGYFAGDTYNELTVGAVSFAQIYVADNTGAQSIASGSTYTKLTCFDSDGEDNDCTADAANDKITITRIGRYKVNFHAAGYSGTANVTFRLAPFLNGSEQVQAISERKFSTASDVGSQSGGGYIDVTSVPVDLDLRARHDNNSAINFTGTCVSMFVERIGHT